MKNSMFKRKRFNFAQTMRSYSAQNSSSQKIEKPSGLRQLFQRPSGNIYSLVVRFGGIPLKGIFKALIK